MFCGKCGTQNAEGIANCVCCGEPLQQEPTQESKPKKTTFLDLLKALSGNKEKMIAVIAVAVAALICFVIILCLIFGGNGPKSVAEKYVKAVTKPDFNAAVKLIHKDVIKEAKKNNKDDYFDFDDIIDGYDEYVEETFEDTYGDDWKIKIKSIEEDDLKKSKLKDIKERYDDDYDIKVTDAKEVEVELKIEGDDDDGKLDYTLIIVKIGGKWYLDYNSLFSF